MALIVLTTAPLMLPRMVVVTAVFQAVWSAVAMVRPAVTVSDSVVKRGWPCSLSWVSHPDSDWA